MALRIRGFSPAALPPGRPVGLILGIVESVLVALMPADFNVAFKLLIALMLLLYLFVPLFTHLHLTRRQVPVSGMAARIGATSAGLVILSTIIVFIISITGVQVAQGGGFFGLRLFGDSFASLAGVVLLHIVGLLLSLIGGWVGGLLGARPGSGRNIYTNNAAPRRRSISHLYLLAALAVCVCLQITDTALQPQSLLAVLASLFRAPGVASYPFSTNSQVTLLSSPTALYADTVTDSFVLRASDGSVVQRVPESVFAAYQDIVYTSTSTSEESLTVVRAIRVSDGKELWSYSFENLNEVQLIDGILYFNKDVLPQQEGLLQAVDPVSGRLLWQYQCLDQGCFVGSAQVHQGIAYVVEQTGAASFLLALHTDDGSSLWQSSMYSYAPQPLLVADRLLLQTASDTFTAYRAQDGLTLWQIHVMPDNSEDTFATISNGTIILISTSKALYAFRADSGAFLWQRQDSPLDIKLGRATVYLSEPASLIALDALSGQKLWEQPFSSWAVKHARVVRSNLGNPVLGESNGMVFIWLKSLPYGFPVMGGVSAFRADNGQPVWQHRFTLPPMPKISTAPGTQLSLAGTDMEALLAGNSVYFTSYLAVTTVIPVHFTLALRQALDPFFNMTIFTLNSQAIDARSGSVKWQNQQVEQYHIA